MGKGRLEAFSDGVIAIIITIMVLEIKVPHEASWHALEPLIPKLLSYVLSFVFVGIYWNNHHHLLHTTIKVDGKVLWANLHLLFWLSLVPFSTGFMGENGMAKLGVGLYGLNLLLAGVAYYLLAQVLLAQHGKDSHFAREVGRDTKGKLSLLLYVSSVICSVFLPIISLTIYIIVALMWLVPDRRIERTIQKVEQENGSSHGPKASAT